MKELISTKEVAKYLGINEKMVYALITEKGLPATKITGKWLFPLHLVEQWVENSTINYPKPGNILPPYHGLLIISGSNDLLLDKTITLFNTQYPDNVAVFGNLGSMGGLRALRHNLCHIASSHLLEDNENDYNFNFASKELGDMPAVCNFCRREQGIILQKGNPKGISKIADLVKPGIRIANRPLGTGTRLLFDRELNKAGIDCEKIEGYHNEVARHLDAGVEVLTGRADAAACIRPVASLLGLDFITLRWESYDLLIQKEWFFDKGVQLFIGLLHDESFREAAKQFEGYDTSSSGKMVFPQEAARD
ncbi:MAG: helix-turn-helix transcriptional regulator [Proteobacteria bacterium]|nr:helix-turn-helix transcriptional regulator [Pseudomonadota bacterium]